MSQRTRLVVTGMASTGLHALALLVAGLIGIVGVERVEMPIDAVFAAPEFEQPLPLVSVHLGAAKEFNTENSQSHPELPGGTSAGRALLMASKEPPMIAPNASSDTRRLAEYLHDSFESTNLAEQVDLVSSAIGRLRNGGIGNGTGPSVGDGNGSEFFGLNPIGKRIVYVLDCSKSMNRPHASEAQTRFKRVKLELVKSIGSLPPESTFYILFFNDYAISMPAGTLEPATLPAKQKYLYWMQRISADGNTEPTAALQMALRLKPDIVYFLTDGDFNARVRQELMSMPVNSTVVQTFAFEEDLTDDMQRAYDLIESGDRTQAMRLISGKDYRKTYTAWRSHEFLRELSERHNGKFTLIP